METLPLWLFGYLAVAVCGLVISVALSLQAWEYHRFARRRFGVRPDRQNRGRAAVFVPCKGNDIDLENNLLALLEQDYADYEVVFVVESADDPACAVIKGLPGRMTVRRGGVSARLVVAGKAEDCGQKVHNLLRATANLHPDVKFLAFADSDARPQPDWLRTLVDRLSHDRNGAVTAYRWFVPLKTTPANLVAASINNSIVPLIGWRRHRMVWGGTWAIRRDVFDESGLREAWQGTLSDDLVASRVLVEGGWRVDFEPRCVVASPVDFDAKGMIEFIRRQLLIGRFYSPFWWKFCFTATTLGMLAFWGGIGLVLAGLLTGASWTWLPGACVAVLMAMSVMRAGWRQDAQAVYLRDGRRPPVAMPLFDIFAAPAGGLVAWIGFAASAVGHSIRWRGITYRLQRRWGVELLGRAAEDAIPMAGKTPSRKGAAAKAA